MSLIGAKLSMNERMSERDILLNQTEYIVEATDNEKHMLWAKFCNKSMYKTELNTYDWEQIPTGYHIHVGDFCGHPVNISCFWMKIKGEKAATNGVLVMFYEAVSRVVDYEMVKKWIEENCSTRHHCNAMNFHLVLDHIRQLGKE
jgi:hypothetical protein